MQTLRFAVTSRTTDLNRDDTSAGQLASREESTLQFQGFQKSRRAGIDSIYTSTMTLAAFF